MSLSTPIVQIIDRDPVTIDIDQKVSEAARALSTERFHHLPVLEERRLVGMLSAADMLRLNASAGTGDDAAYMAALDRSFRLEDIMQKDVVTVSHQATVGDAARLLSAGGFHAVPVIDGQEHLLGVATTTDLISHMLEAPAGAAVPAAVRERIRVLEQVLEAAQHYLRSGMAAHEHERLERVIEAARRAA